ncbi:hypothetical protein [Paenibacillus anseongense]|uniref:hypothetical protein n=1 Tax=Paenibacillus anseongense TaxID=2682845 RepID=UPI002DBC8775|nr:hypothetical protein [Paenibacillus anseongense]MEC0266699.1 hypothetical protein [Paenibacillus anseongense]
MQYSSEEKETTCVYDYIDNEWNIYSCISRHMTKLYKIGDPYWEEKDGDRVTAAKWKLKANQIRFAMETKLTDEQRKAKREHARRSFQQSN